MAMWRAVPLFPLVLLMSAARGTLGGGFPDLGKAVQAIKQADTSKVKDVVKNAAQDPGNVVDAVKNAADPATDVLQNVDASKAVDVAKGVSGKIPQVVTVSTGDGGAGAAQEEATTSTTAVPTVAATKDDQAAKIQNAAKGSSVAGLLGKKNLADLIKGATPEKVAQVVQNADPGKVVGDVAKDAQKFGEAAQDASPKEVAQAVGGGSHPSSLVGKAKDVVSNTGAKEIAGAIGETDVKQLAGSVKSTSPGQVVDSLKDNKVKKATDMIKGKSAAEIGEAISGAKREDLTEAINHHGKNANDKTPPTFLDASQPPWGEGETPTESEGSLPVLVVLVVVAAIVIGGLVLFRHLTKPRQVGMTMLNGDSTGETQMHWMGAGARDVINASTGNSHGFTRF